MLKYQTIDSDIDIPRLLVATISKSVSMPLKKIYTVTKITWDKSYSSMSFSYQFTTNINYAAVIWVHAHTLFVFKSLQL